MRHAHNPSVARALPLWKQLVQWPDQLHHPASFPVCFWLSGSHTGECGSAAASKASVTLHFISRLVSPGFSERIFWLRGSKRKWINGITVNLSEHSHLEIKYRSSALPYFSACVSREEADSFLRARRWEVWAIRKRQMWQVSRDKSNPCVSGCDVR